MAEWVQTIQCFGHFQAILATFLEPYKHVEVDEGYAGEGHLKEKCRSSISIPEEKKKMTSGLRSRQETVNKQLKDWSMLRRAYCHNILIIVMSSVLSVITQLAINNRERLFDIEYKD